MSLRTKPQIPWTAKIASWGFDLALILLVVMGLFLRFSWVDWGQGANLHPDEYGLTNTLTQMRLPGNFAAYFNTRLSPLSPYPKYDLQVQKVADGPDNRMRWGQWPQILIRTAAELTGNTGYDQIRILGRPLSPALVLHAEGAPRRIAAVTRRSACFLMRHGGLSNSSLVSTLIP